MEDGVHERIMAEAERLIAQGGTERWARDPVNQPTISNWLEAMGNTSPRWHEGEAPPSMAQVWTMLGFGVAPADDDPLHGMMRVLTESGYPGVLGTNCEQAYRRTLKVGEHVRLNTALDSVVGPKQTAMGEGYFLTSLRTWYVVGEDGRSEPVATMMFRVLKFLPKEKA